VSNLREGRGPRVAAVPPGDDRQRLVCPDCGYVAYENPRIVVGTVCRWAGRILLCRRAIEPRCGYWTLPAGYLERHERPEEGARREAWEEARARVTVGPLMAVYSLVRISQVQLIYCGRLASPELMPGPESEAVALFTWDEIPWDELAFPTVRWALERDRAVGDSSMVIAASNPEPELPPERW